MGGPLTGYTYKRDQLAAAQGATDSAVAQERTVRDRNYDLQRAQEQAATTNIAGGGSQACSDAAVQARAEAAALENQAAREAGQQRRQLNSQKRKAEAKAELLEGLAAQSDLERQQAIASATQAVDTAQLAADQAAATLQQLRQQAQDLQVAAQAIPDLDAAWAKVHSDPARSLRSLEADLRAMQADLNRLNANAPPGAVQYCAQLEGKLDHDAHHVPCPRCNAEHGIDRTAQAKAAVRALLQEMERLGALPNDNGLTEQQVRDRSIATGMNALRAQGGGKMLGILICTDGTTLKAFSGDSNGIDDVQGWCQHIPPAPQGGALRTANGVDVPLGALPAVQGTPHGVCAAPKLIQEAYRQGKTPAGIAEVWYGGGPVQPHGALVASCSTCRANLDVQLCNHYQ